MIDDDNLKRGLSAAFAVLVALAAVGGAVSLGTSDYAPDPVQDAAEQISPVQEGNATIVTATAAAVTAVAVVQTTKALCNRGYICERASAKELRETDAIETKTSIHRRALTQVQNNKNYLTSVDNTLKGTKSIATREGKWAYIQALNNGSSEALARSKARAAVADYYTVRQQMLIKQWETTVASINSSRYVAENTSNVSASYVHGTFRAGVNYHDSAKVTDWSTTETLPLVNGTSADVLGFRVTMEYTPPGSVSKTKTEVISPVDGEVEATSTDGTHWTYTGVQVNPPNDNYSPVMYIDAGQFKQRWEAIQTQNNEVQSRLDDFINATYSAYQRGEIDSNDLIDPYLGAQKLDPEGSDSWAIRATAALGINPPKNIGSVANMSIVSGSQQYDGLLMTPGDHSIEPGTTYNATNMTGQQFVLNPETGRMTELQGEFTVSDIRGIDGENVESLNYDKTRYKTTNLTEFKEKLNRLDTYSAEINARQQRLREKAGGGGDSGGGFPTLPGMGVWGTLAVLGGGLAAVGATTRIVTGG